MMKLASDVSLVRCATELRPALEAFYNAFEPKGAALGLPPRTPDAVHVWLESRQNYPNFLMIEGGRVVGHALLCPDTYTGEVAIFVAAQHRGQGLGGKLLRALIAEALDLDLRRIWGIAEPDNVPMLHLAHSCGFAPGKELGEFSLDLTALHRQPLPSLDSKK